MQVRHPGAAFDFHNRCTWRQGIAVFVMHSDSHVSYTQSTRRCSSSVGRRAVLN
jgi:hypothetical protein